LKAGILKSGLVRNTGALYLVQIANYVVPLILLPFLTRVLGTGGYGRLATLQAIAAYGLVITDYGFQLSATRKVAAMLEGGQDVRRLYAEVTMARILLALLAAVLMCMTVAALPYLALTVPVAAALTVLVVSNALTPLWLFQGFQKMMLVGSLVLIARLGAAALTLLLVRSPQDVGVALWAQALGAALPAGFALWQAARLVPVNAWPSLTGLRTELADGWPIFQTSVFSAVLTNSGVLILGAMAGTQVAGGYAAVERVGKGVASMLAPVTQAIYPRVSGAFARSYAEGLKMVRRFGLPLFVSSLGLTSLLVGVVLLGGVGWLFGAEYQRYAGALLVLAPWMVLGVVNNLLGIQYLTNTGQQHWYASAFTFSGLLALGLFALLSRSWSYWGIAWGLVVGEAFLTLLLWWRVREASQRKNREAWR
jgi:PST family polysaccharide transporter